MWATSALPRNGCLPVLGGGREAMANDTHGVDARKNREPPFCQKKANKRDVELWRESTYDSNDRSTYGSVCTMAMIWGEIVKPADYSIGLTGCAAQNIAQSIMRSLAQQDYLCILLYHIYCTPKKNVRRRFLAA